MPNQEKHLILLMTTAPPENSAWYLGKRLPPIGLMYVAAALEKAGFEVQMLDNYLMKKPVSELKQLVTSLNPKIVGITCGSATYTTLHRNCKSNQRGSSRMQNSRRRMARLLCA